VNLSKKNQAIVRLRR